MTKEMQTEEFLCWISMTDKEHTTSGSNEVVIRLMVFLQNPFLLYLLRFYLSILRLFFLLGCVIQSRDSKFFQGFGVKKYVAQVGSPIRVKKICSTPILYFSKKFSASNCCYLNLKRIADYSGSCLASAVKSSFIYSLTIIFK